MEIEDLLAKTACPGAPSDRETGMMGTGCIPAQADEVVTWTEAGREVGLLALVKQA